MDESTCKRWIPPVTDNSSLELSRSTQFQRNDWSDFNTVGIEEVYGLVYGKITDQTIWSVADVLGPALSTAVTVGNRSLSDQDIKLLTPSLSLFNSEYLMSKYLADIRLYVEACLTAAENPSGIVQFLVTDDHKFFKVFIQSRFAESVLQKQVKKVFEINKTVHVKLAGEVIPGV